GYGIEDRPPRASRVRARPSATVDRAEVEVARLARNTRGRQHAPTPERADESPVQVLEQDRVHGCRERGGGDDQAGRGEADRKHRDLLRWRTDRGPARSGGES